MMHVLLLGRANCHLCEDAARLLESLQSRFDLDIEELDIETSDDLVAEYGLRIPVVLDTDGRVVAEGLVTLAQLEKGLGPPPGPPISRGRT